jgi:hypothetical protein
MSQTRNNDNLGRLSTSEYARIYNGMIRKYQDESTETIVTTINTDEDKIARLRVRVAALKTLAARTVRQSDWQAAKINSK